MGPDASLAGMTSRIRIAPVTLKPLCRTFSWLPPAVTAQCCVAIALAAVASATASGGDGEALTPEQIADQSRAAIVVIGSSGRTGDALGTGSGFVVSTSGIVVTCLHVIGEGRPFTIRQADGSSLKPTSILAFDRGRDLAVIQTDGKDLRALDLGDSDHLRPGQTVVALGHPLNLGLSVASGAVAQSTEVEGRRLIQLAIPIERGSSGSPLITMDGKVAGVIALKSAESTAFAIPSRDVTSLLGNQRAVPIDRWLTIGALDTQLWRPALGGDWRQRAGRLIASGTGDGFGGRMLCLWQTQPESESFDAEVEVKLEDESGAAGIVIHSDGTHVHQAFYPTNSSLRFTRFEGPDVFSWTILRTLPSEHYRPGEWNRLRVRVRGPHITCFVNGQVVLEEEDGALSGGKVGLVKFREPGAEFRGFRIAQELPPDAADDGNVEVSRIAKALAAGEMRDDEAIASLERLPGGGVAELEREARAFEKTASRLRRLGVDARSGAAVHRLLAELSRPEDEIDLLRATLLLARLDNADLDLEPYVALVDRMASEARSKVEAAANDEERVHALSEFLFEDSAFRGSRLEYYHRSNSYMNEVLDDREGIPITLSVIYLELGRRLGLSLAGVPLPRHFVVELRRTEGEPIWIDVYGGGKIVSRAEAEELSGEKLDDASFAPATKRQIILRMLHNLLAASQREGDSVAMLRYLDALVLLEGQSDSEGGARWLRAMLRFQAGKLDAAREDVEWLLERDSGGVPRTDVEELRSAILRGAAAAARPSEKR
jgi:serine protease Do